MGRLKKGMVIAVIAVIVSFALPMAAFAAVNREVNLYLTDSRFWTPYFSVAWYEVQPLNYGAIMDPDDSSSRVGMAYSFNYTDQGWPGGYGYLRARFTTTGALDTTIIPTAEYDGYLYAGYLKGDFNSDYCAVYIYDSSDNYSVIEGVKTEDLLNENYMVFSFHVTTDTFANLSDIKVVRFDFRIPTSTDPTIVVYDPTIYISDSLGYINDAIKDAADQITDKIDQSTDEITGAIDDAMNGSFESPRPDMGDKVQQTEDDYENAVNDALGGKTQDEIQADVEKVANYDFSKIDTGAVGSIKTFMGAMSVSFGTDYMSLLLFSCTMGAGIYLIGKRRGT